MTFGPKWIHLPLTCSHSVRGAAPLCLTLYPKPKASGRGVQDFCLPPRPPAVACFSRPSRGLHNPPRTPCRKATTPQGNHAARQLRQPVLLLCSRDLRARQVRILFSFLTAASPLPCSRANRQGSEVFTSAPLTLPTCPFSPHSTPLPAVRDLALSPLHPLCPSPRERIMSFSEALFLPSPCCKGLEGGSVGPLLSLSSRARGGELCGFKMVG